MPLLGNFVAKGTWHRDGELGSRRYCPRAATSHVAPGVDALASLFINFPPAEEEGFVNIPG